MQNRTLALIIVIFLGGFLRIFRCQILGLLTEASQVICTSLKAYSLATLLFSVGYKTHFDMKRITSVPLGENVVFVSSHCSSKEQNYSYWSVKNKFQTVQVALTQLQFIALNDFRARKTTEKVTECFFEREALRNLMLSSYSYYMLLSCTTCLKFLKFEAAWFLFIQ